MKDENTLVHAARITQALDAPDIIGANEVQADAVFLIRDQFLELAAHFIDFPGLQAALEDAVLHARTITLQGFHHFCAAVVGSNVITDDQELLDGHRPSTSPPLVLPFSQVKPR